MDIRHSPSSQVRNFKNEMHSRPTLHFWKKRYVESWKMSHHRNRPTYQPPGSMLQQVTKFRPGEFPLFWSWHGLSTLKNHKSLPSALKNSTPTGMSCVAGNYCQWFWLKNQPPSETNPAEGLGDLVFFDTYQRIYQATKLPVYLYNTSIYIAHLHALWDRLATLTFGPLNSIPVHVESWISHGRLLSTQSSVG